MKPTKIMTLPDEPTAAVCRHFDIKPVREWCAMHEGVSIYSNREKAFVTELIEIYNEEGAGLELWEIRQFPRLVDDCETVNRIMAMIRKDEKNCYISIISVEGAHTCSIRGKVRRWMGVSPDLREAQVEAIKKYVKTKTKISATFRATINLTPELLERVNQKLMKLRGEIS